MSFSSYNCLFIAGVLKKLDAVANTKGCSDVREWVHSITNHLYWCAATSTSGQETVAKWISVINHIQDIHEHDDWRFSSCAHGPIPTDTRRLKKWLNPGKYSLYGACNTVL
jgi:hypothetical protein